MIETFVYVMTLCILVIIIYMSCTVYPLVVCIKVVQCHHCTMTKYLYHIDLHIQQDPYPCWHQGEDEAHRESLHFGISLTQYQASLDMDEITL